MPTTTNCIENPDQGDKNAPRTSDAEAVYKGIGERIRLQRGLRGFTQSDLADLAGVKLWQIRRYEHGKGGIDALRLFLLGVALEVPVSFFFDGLQTGLSDDASAASDAAPISEASAPDILWRRETVELVRAYYRIPDAHVRRCILDLVRDSAQSLGAKPARDLIHP